MRSISKEKYEILVNFLQKNKIQALLVADYEDSRNHNLQYLSGQPSDGMVLITSAGESFLIPWDISIAEKYAEVDEIFDISNYQYNSSLALKEVLKKNFGASKIIIGVLDNFPYGHTIKMEALVSNVEFFKEPRKICEVLDELRATKSDFELNQLKKAAEIGNKTIKDIEKFAKNATDETENDFSLLVRKKILEYGADDLAFDTLVANASRAHELHCHPYSTNQKFILPGLALIDFGAKYQGYHSDITIPFKFGSITQKQERIFKIVLKCYEEVLEMVEIDVPVWKIHNFVEQTLKKEGYSMPYSLGHGLGLSVHDSPFLSRKPTDKYTLKYWKEIRLKDGMVFTIEPAIHKQGVGGFRIENDVMIRNGKVEVLTQSKLIEIR